MEYTDNIQIDYKRQNLISIFLVLLLIWGGMYILNYETPENRDDFYHKYITFSGNNVKRVESLQEILTIQPQRYMETAGRTIINIAEYTFTGLLGKSVFNFINPIIFTIFILALSAFLGKISPSNILFSFSVALFLFPIWADTCLWLSGSINYLWPCTSISIFLIYYLKINNAQKNNLLKYIWIFLCFLIGWGHESLSFPLAISLILAVTIFQKRETSKLKKIMAFAFILGACVCFFAPGNFNRVNRFGQELIPIDERIEAGISLLTQLRAFIILLILVFIISIYQFKRNKNFSWLKRLYLENAVLINALIFSFAFLFVSGSTGRRIITAPEFYSILLLLILFSKVKSPISVWLKSVVIIAAIPVLFGIFYYTNLNYCATKRYLDRIESRTSEVIIYDPVNIPFLFPKYVANPIPKDLISHMQGMNKNIARLYDYNRIVFLARPIYNLIISMKLPMEQSKQENLPFYIVPLNNIRAIKLIDDQDYEFNFINSERIIKLPAKQSEVMKIDGRLYLFIRKYRSDESLVKEIFAAANQKI
ncbi:MAG: hypothetical protein J1E38_05115 [Paramuribaculum sp.]|nr:hypothetical protein [Paramuribaculum sp.]